MDGHRNWILGVPPNYWGDFRMRIIIIIIVAARAARAATATTTTTPRDGGGGGCMVRALHGRGITTG
jgi:hypothetical protein